MITIIGSGPSGVAAAVLLVQRGLAVTLIDGGQQLEAKTHTILKKIQRTPFESWDASQINALSMDVAASAKGVQLKLAYGSDYPYRLVDKEIPRAQENIGHCTPTLAVGGFSTVWGSAILPFIESEISDWPITTSDLSGWYQSVLSFVPLSGKRDHLEQFFPLHKNDLHSLKLGSQAEKLLKNFQRRHDLFITRGLYAGHSRLAVFSEQSVKEKVANFDGRQSCCYCGRCLYGCPYSLIYSTAQTLEYLKSLPNFTYVSGRIVEELREEGSEIIVSGRSLNDNQPFSLRSSRVFVGAGVLSSAQILLRSMGAINTPVSAKVSEYFLLPLFSLYKNKEVFQERTHTLAQLFIECFDKSISDYSVHMQLYTYSDLYRKAFEKLLKRVPWFSPLFSNEVLSRLHVIQGYTHSAESSSMEIKLLEDKKTLDVRGVVNPKARAIIKKISKKLLAVTPYTKLIPCLPMLSIGKPGEGRHVGGTFPMSKTPARFETDTIGRVPGFEKVHLIDSSVFPSIPASTITLTIMANAQRIASEALQLS